jgi:hypothetical protein
VIPREQVESKIFTRHTRKTGRKEPRPTRGLGDDWLTKGSAALLTVLSAIVPRTFNVLLTPAHEDAKRIVVVQTGEHAIDSRLVK